jgi:hypothetical protein
LQIPPRACERIDCYTPLHTHKKQQQQIRIHSLSQNWMVGNLHKKGWWCWSSEEVEESTRFVTVYKDQPPAMASSVPLEMQVLQLQVMQFALPILMLQTAMLLSSFASSEVWDWWW